MFDEIVVRLIGESSLDCYLGIGITTDATRSEIKEIHTRSWLPR